MVVPNYVAVSIFLVVYSLIVLRNLRWFRIPVWTVMLAGAVAMIFLNAIPLDIAYQSVNLDVIFFLIGMFTIVTAMDLSGLLEHITIRIVRLAKTPTRIFAMIIFGFAAMSAFLMNDTLAVMGTPIILSLSKQMKMRPPVLLIALMMGITIGSVVTPVGNPQNLLIAVSSGIPNPFFNFLYYLLPPTLLSLIASYLILRTLFRKDLKLAQRPSSDQAIETTIRDPRLAKISSYTIMIVIVGFFLVGTTRLFGIVSNANLGTVALLGGTIIYVLSSRRREIVHAIDWGV
ncbi:MAG TPA: SLC13 family permease, partial [Candidatus Binatus sp.]|nr:SLC13 family permease [Candidatus Binatus sp.]